MPQTCSKILSFPTHFRMANTQAGCGGHGNAEIPNPPDPNMAQMLRLIMEDRQAAQEAQQANTTALQQIVANMNPQQNNGAEGG